MGTRGQLGTGQIETEAVLTAVESFASLDVVELALVAFLRTCVRDGSGTTYCVGRNDAGQIGLGMADPDPVVQPQAVPALAGLSLRGGGFHTCGLADDGALFCWGRNDYGQLGDGSGGPQLSPVQIGEPVWTSLAANTFNTCAIDVDERLWCWGNNEHGQVGDGMIGDVRPVPTEVVEGAQ